ncbi:MAG: malic enzyme-like NAD(P)-binding protein, partial [Campylobacterales bacterium]
NPTPEIMPEVVRKMRPDAIVATGRSDFPNQVNNVLGFPFIFRGAVDVRATAINTEMKIAAAEALAALARTDVPDYIQKLYGGGIEFGRDYLIPKPFDKRLIVEVSGAVAAAAVRSGVARVNDFDLDAYRRTLGERICLDCLPE